MHKKIIYTTMVVGSLFICFLAWFNLSQDHNKSTILLSTGRQCENIIFTQNEVLAVMNNILAISQFDKSDVRIRAVDRVLILDGININIAGLQKLFEKYLEAEVSVAKFYKVYKYSNNGNKSLCAYDPANLIVAETRPIKISPYNFAKYIVLELGLLIAGFYFLRINKR